MNQIAIFSFIIVVCADIRTKRREKGNACTLTIRVRKRTENKIIVSKRRIKMQNLVFKK